MPPVSVECFVLGEAAGEMVFDEGEAKAFAATWTREVTAGDPQAALEATAPMPLLAAPHSTSWRFQDGLLVLTFVAFPSGGTPLARPRPVPVYRGTTGADGSTGLGAAVVGHAARHVAFLIRTDPGFATPDPDRWSTISERHVPEVFRDLTER